MNLPPAPRQGRGALPTCGSAAGREAAEHVVHPATFRSAVAPLPLRAVPRAPNGAWVVDVWVIRTDLTADQTAELAAHLDDEERSRLSGPAASRARFTVSHAAARLLTAAAAGVPPSAVRWRRGPHGRPYPEGLDRDLTVNLSTSGAWSLLALAPAGADVGVDLEPEPPLPVALRLAHRWFPPTEAAEVAAAPCPPTRFAELWTRKEAYVKALGARLAEGLSVPAGGPLVGPSATCLVQNIPLPPDLPSHRAAVARRSTEPFAVRLHTWSPPSATREAP